MHSETRSAERPDAPRQEGHFGLEPSIDDIESLEPVELGKESAIDVAAVFSRAKEIAGAAARYIAEIASKGVELSREAFHGVVERFQSVVERFSSRADAADEAWMEGLSRHQKRLVKGLAPHADILVDFAELEEDIGPMRDNVLFAGTEQHLDRPTADVAREAQQFRAGVEAALNDIGRASEVLRGVSRPERGSTEEKFAEMLRRFNSLYDSESEESDAYRDTARSIQAFEAAHPEAADRVRQYVDLKRLHDEASDEYGKMAHELLRRVRTLDLKVAGGEAEYAEAAEELSRYLDELDRRAPTSLSSVRARKAWRQGYGFLSSSRE